MLFLLQTDAAPQLCAASTADGGASSPGKDGGDSKKDKDGAWFSPQALTNVIWALAATRTRT